MAEKMNSNTETVQENSTMDKKTDSPKEAVKKTETAGTKAAVKKEETAGTKATVKKEAAAGTQGTVKKEAAAGTKATVKKEAAAGTKATASGTKAAAGTKATAAGTKTTAGTKAATGTKATAAGTKAAVKKETTAGTKTTAGTRATVKKEAAAGTATTADASKDRRKFFSFAKRTKPGNDPAAQKKGKAGDGPQELSDALEGLISKDITTMKHREKTRAAEMLSIFAKHNFYAGGFSPVELRTTLEDLGPTYVKIGQIMSSRVDMLPESYCRELEKLRQNVKPLEASVVRAVIEQETGKKIEEIYSDFDDEPLGSASIGQVHKATLLDGTQVVTKVQRPLIAEMMRKDFVLLRKLANGVKIVNEGNEDQGEQIDLLEVLEELEKVENEELDFRVEARNTTFFRENCIEDETRVTCPAIFEELTTERMMTSTFIDGYSIMKKDKITEAGLDVNAIGEAILDNYVHQILDVGVFHADPHQGNIMIDRRGIPTWIDFGMLGRLDQQNIRLIQDLILAIINTDTEALVNAALSMGAGGPRTSREKLAQDLDGLISKYMSVSNLEELDTAALLGEVMDIMSDNYIKIPGEYTMLVRSIATIEGVMEELCPQLNLFKLITDKLLERAQKSFDLRQTLMSAGKDAAAIGKKASRIPSLVCDALNNINKGRTKVRFELTGYEDLLSHLTETVKIIILAMFSCVLFFGSCILCLTDIQPTTVDGVPLMAAVGFIFSIALGIYAVKKITQLQKKK